MKRRPWRVEYRTGPTPTSLGEWKRVRGSWATETSAQHEAIHGNLGWLFSFARAHELRFVNVDDA